jgi:PhnB protein
MARTSTYLNFSSKTEEAFLFYRSVFGGEFLGEGVQKFGSMPPMEGVPPMSDEIKNLVLHVELAILGGHVLMGTDAPESMGFQCVPGSQTYINLEPDSKEEAQRLYEQLSIGGTIIDPIGDTFWGAYYGSLQDQFGIRWMVNFAAKS